MIRSQSGTLILVCTIPMSMMRPLNTDVNAVAPDDYHSVHSVNASLSFQHTTFRGSEATVRDGFYRNAYTASSAWTPPEPIPGGYPSGSSTRIPTRRRPSGPEIRQQIRAKHDLQTKRTNRTQFQVKQWIHDLPDSLMLDVPPLFQTSQPHETGDCPLPDDDDSDTSVRLGEALYTIAREFRTIGRRS